LDRLEWLKYPKERINLKFFYNNEAHDYYFGKFSERNKGYGSLEFFKREKHLDSIIEFLNSDMDVDVYMVMESNYIFRNEDSLKVLLNSDIKILAPMIVSEKSDFANFHVWNTGLKKSYQTYSNKGFWTVDIISGIILISKDFVQTTKEILLDKTNHSDGDWDVKLSEGLKKKDYFAYICNTNYFGTII
jgi:hypothetical protein